MTTKKEIKEIIEEIKKLTVGKIDKKHKKGKAFDVGFRTARNTLELGKAKLLTKLLKKYA